MLLRKNSWSCLSIIYLLNQSALALAGESNNLSQAIMYRGLERISIVIAGTLLLILGWDLFRKGIIDQQSGVIKTDTITIRISKAGPGIFFAAFGTWVLVTSINNPLIAPNFNQPNTPAPPPATTTQAPSTDKPSKQFNNKNDFIYYGGNSVNENQIVTKAIFDIVANGKKIVEVPKGSETHGTKLSRRGQLQTPP